MTENAKLDLRKVAEINRPEYTFYIPSYQRGYRWDTKQVKELLEDIHELIFTGRKDYCLQPIVVKTLEKDKRFEVIDGQQRLTTLYLLLLKLRHDSSTLFKLDYETRQGCVKFFEGLKQGEFNYTNPDFAHISAAYELIDSWVNERLKLDSSADLELTLVVTKYLQIIWYELPPKEKDDRKDSVKIFTRLNVGKIPLTSAELIKAIFLSNENFNVHARKNGTMYTADYQFRQIELASDWNQMEYALHNPGFWNFINKEESLTSTRIDFIFSLVTRLNKVEIKDEYDVFRFFYEHFGEAKQLPQAHGMLMAELWDQVKNCFSVLSEWYADKELYHTIGYLIWSGMDILKLYDLYLSESKKAFKELLDTEIGKTLKGIEVERLFYGSNSTLVNKVLVLFNVLSAKNSEDTSIRFPFERLKVQNNRWSLEHIHAQNAEDINEKDYQIWMEDHAGVLTRANKNGGDAITSKITQFLTEMPANFKSANLKGSFEQLAGEIIDFLSEKGTNKDIKEVGRDPWVDVDHISNMALLDGKSNSSLGNSVFAVKREKILQKERDGAFIPQATKNVFLKYYSDYPEHLIYWTIEDRKKYIKKITELINPLIKK